MDGKKQMLTALAFLLVTIPAGPSSGTEPATRENESGTVRYHGKLDTEHTGYNVNGFMDTFSGSLFDSDGNSVGAPKPVNVDGEVRLMDAETGGELLYSETFTAANNNGITVDNGHFAIRLGEGTTSGNLLSTVLNNNNLWAEIVIEGGAPLPRMPLAGATYVIID